MVQLCVQLHNEKLLLSLIRCISYSSKRLLRTEAERHFGTGQVIVFYPFLWRWLSARHAASKSLQSSPTPSDRPQPTRLLRPWDSPRTPEWVAISFSNAWKWKVKVKSLRRVRLSATPWTAAYQAPLSMGFSRQEYWSGVPLPSPTARQRNR